MASKWFDPHSTSLEQHGFEGDHMIWTPRKAGSCKSAILLAQCETNLFFKRVYISIIFQYSSAYSPCLRASGFANGLPVKQLPFSKPTKISATVRPSAHISIFLNCDNSISGRVQLKMYGFAAKEIRSELKRYWDLHDVNSLGNVKLNIKPLHASFGKDLHGIQMWWIIFPITRERILAQDQISGRSTRTAHTYNPSIHTKNHKSNWKHNFN